jgi:predicted enzyme involved in methoxymalonyl-ACP biosynthesis
MLHLAVEEARQRGVDVLAATYIPTTKNMPCLEFLRASGLACDAVEELFTWDTSTSYPLPESVDLVVPVHA